MSSFASRSTRVEAVAQSGRDVAASALGARRLKESRKFWARWRVRLGYPVALVYWALAAPSTRSIAIGGIVAAFGSLIRGLASGHLRKDEQLATTGPYACTRNPLYLGSAFLAAGFVVAGLSWIGGAIVSIYFTVFYYAVMRSEESDVRERFGAAYDEYARQVPFFFPSYRRSAVPTTSTKPMSRHFSWPQYMRNREYQALIGTLAGLGAVWLRMWIRARYGY